MMSNGSIYLVDDDETMRLAAAQWLSLAGFEVETFPDAAKAMEKLSPGFSGVLVTDVLMPGIDGLALMRETLAMDQEIPVVLITGHGDVAMAVSAIREGAYDFIEKPFQPEALVETIKRACEKRRLVLENRALRRCLRRPDDIEARLIGNSDVIRLLRQEVVNLAVTDVSVLISGNTGCGKELVARCLHDYGPRRNEKFVAINCGAIPEHLFESELFGHESGAFTGAHGQRIGKFEYAHGGTLFLDEITSMPMNLQVKVLRALQEREIERLGSNNPIPIDVRIISATNLEPRQACADGVFREDLFYRLNVAELRIPSLMQRRSDIPLLFEFFLNQAACTYEREAPPLPDEALAELMVYDWPGNIRELKNVAERYTLSNQVPGQPISRLLQNSETQHAAVDGGALAEQINNFERCIIEQSLRRHKGNISKVMISLDLPRRTLNQKMVKFKLDRKAYL